MIGANDGQAIGLRVPEIQLNRPGSVVGVALAREAGTIQQLFALDKLADATHRPGHFGFVERGFALEPRQSLGHL